MRRNCFSERNKGRNPRTYFATFAPNRLSPQTVQTERDRRVSGEAFGFNILPTIGAITVFAVVDPFEGGVDFLAFGGAAAGLRLGHSLGLQRIHSGETPDGLLIQLHRFLALLASGVFCVELCEARVEAGFCSHGCSVARCEMWRNPVVEVSQRNALGVILLELTEG